MSISSKRSSLDGKYKCWQAFRLYDVARIRFWVQRTELYFL